MSIVCNCGLKCTTLYQAHGVVNRKQSSVATSFSSSSSPLTQNGSKSFPLSDLTISSTSDIQNSPAYFLDSFAKNISNKQPIKASRSERVSKRKEQPRSYTGSTQRDFASTSQGDQKHQQPAFKLAPIRTSLPEERSETPSPQSRNMSKVRKRGQFTSPHAQAFKGPFSWEVENFKVQNKDGISTICTSAPISPSRCQNLNAEGLGRDLQLRTARLASSDLDTEFASSRRTPGSIASWPDIMDTHVVHDNPLFVDLDLTPMVILLPA